MMAANTSTKPLVLTILALLCVSCASIKQPNHLISYHFVPHNHITAKVIGDYQAVPLTTTDAIWIMPAYFRNYGSLEDVLVVRVKIDKKYGFKKLASVASKTFGDLTITRDKGRQQKPGTINLLYTKSLKKMDPTSKKNSLLRDTINIGIGNKQWLFTPKTK